MLGDGRGYGSTVVASVSVVRTSSMIFVAFGTSLHALPENAMLRPSK